MVVTPNTNITLLKTPFELDSLNQLTFSSKQAQYNYFNSLPKLSYDNATYQRKDGVIAFPTSPTGVTYEDLIQYNYCMYQNESYNDKWFYAYITKVTYDNNGMSYIEIETDVFQTWQFDITYKPSFIDREMLAKSDDVVGANTIPENLETGEYIDMDHQTYSYNGYYTCIAVSENLFEDNQAPVKTYNSIPSGLTYIILKTSADIQKAIWLYDQKTEALYSLFVIPEEFVPTPTWRQWTWTFGSIQVTIDYAYVPNSVGTISLGNIDISLPSSINGYTPKNNKLFTFPYNFIKADNNCGINTIYHYELFSNMNQCRFNQRGIINIGCAIKSIPLNYKNTQVNYNESFNNAKLPVGSWLNDPYTNWLTQNSVNMKMNVIEGGLSTGLNAGMVGAGLFGGAGALIGGIGGGLAGSFTGILNNMIQSKEHDYMPKQVSGNTNSSDIMFSAGNIAPVFYRTCIKQEFARCIDDFFSMFGYKTNRVKLPNINNRSNWNYVKTKGCNIIGDIPQADLQKIKNLFDNGFTLWHNPNTFLDYSQANN